jgi:hypothetical protein
MYLGMSTNYEVPHCATSSIPLSPQILLGPNILLTTLFSNTLSLCFSLNMRDQVSHSYKTNGRIMVLYILTSDPSRDGLRKWREKLKEWM